MKTNLRNLPVKDRIRLVEDIWDSISSDQNLLSLSASQKKELDLRMSAYEIDKNKGRLAEEVLSNIQNRL
jgi:putative addiction module component (TIGR02574 family)